MFDKLIEQIVNETNKFNNEQTNTETDTETSKNEPIFKLPIEHLDDKDKVKIEEHTITDLELLKTDKHESLYTYVFNPTSIFSYNLTEQWGKYYTSNTNFLKDTQELLKYNVKNQTDSLVNDEMQKDVLEIWSEIQSETGFNEKYSYIEWQRLQILNNNSTFLQCLSIYNLASPLFSLMLPIIFLIIPLLIIKLKGLPITIDKYIELLKIVFQKHQIGKIFDLSNASFEKLVYVFASSIFYIIQVYQNIMTCRRFVCNMTKIHKQLFTMKDYLSQTIKNMDNLLLQCKELKTYSTFRETIEKHRLVCIRMKKQIDKVTPNKLCVKKISQIGHVMKCFYMMYRHSYFHETLVYTFGINGYIDNINGLVKNIKLKHIGQCKYKKGINKFEKAYFPSLVNEKPVKNTYKLDKHLIITGPNAAGKTTLLKTTIFNIILSQQLGYGFYKKANIHPYDMIHCYINIPDTSGRDSLFQAEAKRCKDILNHIIYDKESGVNDITDSRDNTDNIDLFSNTKRHFCVFDELYSGTNPYEAISSAYAFLKFLNKNNNVNFVLTTHFLELCRRLEKEQKINNFHMKINITNNDFNYTYKLEKGISDIKGGIKVLKDLNYPNEIIENTKTTLTELDI